MINKNDKTISDNIKSNNSSLINKEQNKNSQKNEGSFLLNEHIPNKEQKPFIPQLRPFLIPEINYEYLQDISHLKGHIDLEDIAIAIGCKYSLRDIFNMKNIRFRSEFTQFPFTMTAPVLFKGEDITNYTNFPMMQLTKDSITIVQYKKQDPKLKQKVNSIHQANESIGNHSNTNNIHNKISTRDVENTGLGSIHNENSQHSYGNKDNCIHNKSMISLNEIYDFDNPIFHLNFNYVTTSFKINTKKLKIALTVLSLTNKHFYIKIPKQHGISLFKKIVLLLYNAIVNSRGSKTNLLGVSLRNNFSKYYFMNPKDFESKAKTGDILIFRGFEFAAKLQRFYTKSEYDHVALLTRTNDVLYVYEATSKDGCKQRPWRDFMIHLWNLLYDKIVYRELIINTDNEDEKKQLREMIETKAEIFLNKTEGKNYHLSLCSILCCSKEKEYERKNMWEQSKGFSCSSLITGAYLNMGIVEYSKDIDTVLPGDFSKEKSFLMNKPFELGPEIIIDFTTN